MISPAQSSWLETFWKDFTSSPHFGTQVVLFSGQFRSLKYYLKYGNTFSTIYERSSSYPPYLAGSPHPRWLLLDPRCCCSCLTGCTAGAGRRSTPCRGSYHLWTSLGKVLKSNVQCIWYIISCICIMYMIYHFSSLWYIYVLLHATRWIILTGTHWICVGCLLGQNIVNFQVWWCCVTWLPTNRTS